MTDHHTPEPIRPIEAKQTRWRWSPRMIAWMGSGLMVVVLLALIIGALMYGHSTASSHKAAQPSTLTPSASSGVDTRPDGPNGCVGGADVTTAISTAFNEPITPKGAIEFVATVQRWLVASTVGTQQMQSVGGRLVNASTLKVYTDQLAALPAGTSTSYSTQSSTAWVKEFDAQKKTATILFTGQAQVSQGTDAVTRDTGSVVTLTVKDGHWFISSQNDGGHGSDAPSTIGAEITAGGGGPLAGGC